MTDLALHLATPAIITADMSETEIQIEFEQMMLRSTATSEFVNGRIDAECFVDALDAGGVHIDAALRDWSRGLTFMGG
jgi:hypothetical protein